MHFLYWIESGVFLCLSVVAVALSIFLIAYDCAENARNRRKAQNEKQQITAARPAHFKARNQRRQHQQLQQKNAMKTIASATSSTSNGVEHNALVATDSEEASTNSLVSAWQTGPERRGSQTVVSQTAQNHSAFHTARPVGMSQASFFGVRSSKSPTLFSTPYNRSQERSLSNFQRCCGPTADHALASPNTILRFLNDSARKNPHGMKGPIRQLVHSDTPIATPERSPLQKRVTTTTVVSIAAYASPSSHLPVSQTAPVMPHPNTRSGSSISVKGGNVCDSFERALLPEQKVLGRDCYSVETSLVGSTVVGDELSVSVNGIDKTVEDSLSLPTSPRNFSTASSPIPSPKDKKRIPIVPRAQGSIQGGDVAVSSPPQSPFAESPGSALLSTATLFPLFHGLGLLLSLLLCIRLLDFHSYLSLLPSGFQLISSHATSALLFFAASFVARGLLTACVMASSPFSVFQMTLQRAPQHNCCYALTTIFRACFEQTSIRMLRFMSPPSFFLVLSGVVLVCSIVLPALDLAFDEIDFNAAFLCLFTVALLALLLSLQLSIRRVAEGLTVDARIVGVATATKFQAHSSRLRRLLATTTLIVVLCVCAMCFQVIYAMINPNRANDEFCDSSDSTVFCLNLYPSLYGVAQIAAIYLMLYYAFPPKAFTAIWSKPVVQKPGNTYAANRTQAEADERDGDCDRAHAAVAVPNFVRSLQPHLSAALLQSEQPCVTGVLN